MRETTPEEQQIFLDGYEEDIRQGCSKCGIPEYMHRAIVDYVINGYEQGSFLMAVFENDFMGMAGRADAENQKALFGYADLLHNYVPRDCFGNAETVAAWVVGGGLRGLI